MAEYSAESIRKISRLATNSLRIGTGNLIGVSGNFRSGTGNCPCHRIPVLPQPLWSLRTLLPAASHWPQPSLRGRYWVSSSDGPGRSTARRLSHFATVLAETVKPNLASSAWIRFCPLEGTTRRGYGSIARKLASSSRDDARRDLCGGERGNLPPYRDPKDEC